MYTSGPTRDRNIWLQVAIFFNLRESLPSTRVCIIMLTCTLPYSLTTLTCTLFYDLTTLTYTLVYCLITLTCTLHYGLNTLTCTLIYGLSTLTCTPASERWHGWYIHKTSTQLPLKTGCLAKRPAEVEWDGPW